MAVAPTLMLTDFSGFSCSAPSDCAIALPTATVLMSTGTPEMKLVDVVVKNCWCSDGARKPLEIDPRKA